MNGESDEQETAVESDEETEVEPDETESQVEVCSSSRLLLREVKDLYLLYGTYLAGYSSSYI